MITAMQLFGRSELTDRERRIIRCAQKAADAMWENRFESFLRDEWDKDVYELTKEDVELNVIESILGKYNFDAKRYSS